MGYEGKVHGIHGFLLTKKAFIKLTQNFINQFKEEYVNEEGLSEGDKAWRLENIDAFEGDVLHELPGKLMNEWKEHSKVNEGEIVVYALPHDEVDRHEKGDGRFAVIGVDTSPDRKNKIKTGYSQWEKEVPEEHLVIGESPMSSYSQIIAQLEKHNARGRERFVKVKERFTAMLKEKEVETIDEVPETYFVMDDCLCCT
jgi:hypothetical protein